MQREYQFSDNNILRISERSVKKDDGINAVLILLKDLRDFQDKVNVCLENQTNVEARQSIERHQSSLEQMYSDLIEVAKGGVKSIRKRPENQEEYSGETLPQESLDFENVKAPIEPTM